MITTIVQFPLPQGTTREKARELFEGTAPRYREVPGLVRKYYLYDAAAMLGGGCYLWRDRRSAERALDDAWRELIVGRYGAEPEIWWFDTPVVVDNEAGEIAVD